MTRRCRTCPRRITASSGFVHCADCRKLEESWLREVRRNLRPLSPVAIVLREILVRTVVA